MITTMITDMTIVMDSREVSDTTAELDVWQRLHDCPEIFERLSAATGGPLAVQKQLRQRFADDLVRLALLVHDLRGRAVAKFTRANAMWFDRTEWEQATAEPIARHKALRFPGPVTDLCCSIGGDTLALAGQVASVLAIDLDAGKLQRCRWNTEVYGVGERVETLQADATTLDHAGRWVHIDPDRRPEATGRVRRIEDAVPGWPFLQELMQSARGGAIKLSPASNFAGKFPAGQVELISLGGECKEATVWFGELAGTEPFRATVLPAGVSLAGHPLADVADHSSPQAYLYDPDPAVVRAGLLDRLCVEQGLSRLDAADEYLTADSLRDSPFVQAFEVLDVIAPNDRIVRDCVRSRNWSEVEIKCRHVGISPEQLRKQLPLAKKSQPGGARGTLIYAHVAGHTRVIVARRVIRPD